MFPSNTRFLVVDDFSSMRKIIIKALADLGFTMVEETVDGKQAFQKLLIARNKGQPFDLVISDWAMPEMNGLQLLKNCKADPRLKDLPFILIIAESEEKNILEAAKAGVSDCLVKPFNSQILQEKLTRIFEKQRSKAS